MASTYHPELATLRAVSTVPPRTTSFMPSIIEEPPPPPTRGCTRDLRASMVVYVYAGVEESQCCRRSGGGYGGGGRRGWGRRWWREEDKQAALGKEAERQSTIGSYEGVAVVCACCIRHLSLVQRHRCPQGRPPALTRPAQSPLTPPPPPPRPPPGLALPRHHPAPSRVAWNVRDACSAKPCRTTSRSRCLAPPDQTLRVRSGEAELHTAPALDRSSGLCPGCRWPFFPRPLNTT